jgi:magnesium transporter
VVHGLQAGTPHVSPDRESASSLHAVLYDAAGRDREVDLHEVLAKGLDTNQLLWVDIDGRGETEFEALRDNVQLASEVTALLTSDDATPRLLRYPDRVLLRLVATQPRDPEGRSDEHTEEIDSAPIDIIVAPNMVITVHAGPIRAFEEFRGEVRGDSALGALDAADFLTILVDSVLAVYLELVEGIERRIDALDEVALNARQEETFLDEVVALRRRVAVVRRALAPHRRAFAPLSRPDFELEGVGKPWSGVVDRLDRAIDAVGNARELLIGAFDVYMARSAQRANDVMKALTVLSAILLPAVVIGGVMGMNFKIGFFDNPNNFWLAVGTMLALATGVVGVSRWRGWI